MTANRRTPGTHWRQRPLRFAQDSETLRRLLAALNRHHAEEPCRQVPAAPLDSAAISRTVTEALAFQLPLPERAWVDMTTLKLRGHLQLLLSEFDGDADAPPARTLHGDAYRLLALCDSFDATAPFLHAYELMRALAETTRSFADLHEERQQAQAAKESDE
ncbi:DUF6415 family natural product biosynthesis protein [Streptomyces sp. NBC_01508]|uniref:DUF6415 family natural product biosynthesis protein n=1 Tax=Streptomyces sp. NBC_01508 TaxID=2903888 RepID=UPI00386BF819